MKRGSKRVSPSSSSGSRSSGAFPAMGEGEGRGRKAKKKKEKHTIAAESPRSLPPPPPPAMEEEKKRKKKETVEDEKANKIKSAVDDIRAAIPEMFGVLHLPRPAQSRSRSRWFNMVEVANLCSLTPHSIPVSTLKMVAETLKLLAETVGTYLHLPLDGFGNLLSMVADYKSANNRENSETRCWDEEFIGFPGRLSNYDRWLKCHETILDRWTLMPIHEHTLNKAIGGQVYLLQLFAHDFCKAKQTMPAYWKQQDGPISGSRYDYILLITMVSIATRRLMVHEDDFLVSIIPMIREAYPNKWPPGIVEMIAFYVVL